MVNSSLGSEFVIGAGLEFLSGTDQGSSMNKNNSFNPFYGTNHKFNGWMDYFYVGNHINNVGLLDINTTFIYQKNKLKFILTPHFFSADGDVLKPNLDKSDAFMGTEIDFEFSYKVIKDVLLNIGYSQMFATETMEIIKGGSKDETNNWAWVMITFKPTFFHKKLEK